MLAEVMKFYQQLDESKRLTTVRGRLEFLRTWDVLTRMLPPPPASVLDVGGATGVYAGPLAAAGYRVHVVDPVPEHARLAGQLPGVTSEVGNALALSQDDHSWDAVLLFGPLYHLIERSDRIRAWSEAARVLRKDGIVLAATISRFASMFAGIRKRRLADPGFVSVVDRALQEGIHANVDVGPSYFTTAYFHHPDELPREVSAAGLTVVKIVGLENALSMARRQDLEELLDDPYQRELLLSMLRRVEDDASMHGSSSHLITVARWPS